MAKVQLFGSSSLQLTGSTCYFQPSGIASSQSDHSQSCCSALMQYLIPFLRLEITVNVIYHGIS